jgi:hypothetical protein
MKDQTASFKYGQRRRVTGKYGRSEKFSKKLIMY